MPERFDQSFGSFSDLRKAFQVNTDDETTQERFEEVLKGKFGDIQPGNFMSRLEGIDSLSVAPIRGKNAAAGSAPEQLFASIFFKTAGGKETHVTWSIGQEGQYNGDLPAELASRGLTKDQIFREVIDTLDRASLGFWYQSERSILEGRDEGLTREASDTDEEHVVEPRVDDPERLRFLSQLPGALTGFTNKDLGFNGYQGVITQDAIVLDHPYKGNAAFILRLTAPIEVDPSTFDLPPAERMTRDEREALLEKYWDPIAADAKTRSQLRALGATRVRHDGPPEEWQAKILNAVRGPEAKEVAK